jgi:hypothetical protein
MLAPNAGKVAHLRQCAVMAGHEHDGRIMGANVRAEAARQEAKKTARAADRTEAEAWSVRMEGYGGPTQRSQPSANASTAVTAGSRSNAADARRGQVYHLMLSQGAGYADLEVRTVLSVLVLRHAPPQATGSDGQAD